MGIGRIKVVSDTGPLIHLIEIGCPNLVSIFHLIHVPEAIQLEFDKHMSAHHFDITSFDNAKIHKLPQKEVSQFTNPQSKSLFSHSAAPLH